MFNLVAYTKSALFTLIAKKIYVSSYKRLTDCTDYSFLTSVDIELNPFLEKLVNQFGEVYTRKGKIAMKDIRYNLEICLLFAISSIPFFTDADERKSKGYLFEYVDNADQSILDLRRLGSTMLANFPADEEHFIHTNTESSTNAFRSFLADIITERENKGKFTQQPCFNEHNLQVLLQKMQSMYSVDLVQDSVPPDLSALKFEDFCSYIPISLESNRDHCIDLFLQITGRDFQELLALTKHQETIDIDGKKYYCVADDLKDLLSDDTLEKFCTSFSHYYDSKQSPFWTHLYGSKLCQVTEGGQMSQFITQRGCPFTVPDSDAKLGIILNCFKSMTPMNIYTGTSPLSRDKALQILMKFDLHKGLQS